MAQEKAESKYIGGNVNRYLSFRVGEQDRQNCILVKTKPPLQLWKTTKGNYIIDFWVGEDEDALSLRTMDWERAERLFDQADDLLRR